MIEIYQENVTLCKNAVLVSYCALEIVENVLMRKCIREILLFSSKKILETCEGEYN